MASHVRTRVGQPITPTRPNRRGEHAQGEARAINAEPWKPLRGMTKRRCLACWYWFAAPVGTPRRACCPDCMQPGSVARRQAAL